MPKETIVKLKDLELKVPYRHRDVDLLTFKELMAKTETFVNILKNNMLEIYDILERIEDIDLETLELNTVHYGPDRPEKGIKHDLWIREI